MKTIKVKITGGGTREQVSHALELISKAIRNTPIEDLDGCEWEDCTLMTEIEDGAEDLVVCPGCNEEINESHLYCPNCGDENF